MAIPVDAILLRGSGVTCDESAMTGESVELKKDTLKGCLEKKDEFEADAGAKLESEKDPHAVPSPILLSGT